MAGSAAPIVSPKTPFERVWPCGPARRPVMECHGPGLVQSRAAGHQGAVARPGDQPSLFRADRLSRPLRIARLSCRCRAWPGVSGHHLARRQGRTSVDRQHYPGGGGAHHRALSGDQSRLCAAALPICGSAVGLGPDRRHGPGDPGARRHAPHAGAGPAGHGAGLHRLRAHGNQRQLQPDPRTAVPDHRWDFRHSGGRFGDLHGAVHYLRRDGRAHGRR